MKILHTEQGFTATDKLKFRSVIYSNIVRNMKILSDAIDKLPVPLENEVFFTRKLSFIFQLISEVKSKRASRDQQLESNERRARPVCFQRLRAASNRTLGRFGHSNVFCAARHISAWREYSIFYGAHWTHSRHSIWAHSGFVLIFIPCKFISRNETSSSVAYMWKLWQKGFENPCCIKTHPSWRKNVH